MKIVFFSVLLDIQFVYRELMLGVFSCVFLAPSSKSYCFFFAPCLNAIKTWFALIYFFFFPISIFSHEIEEEREKEKK